MTAPPSPEGERERAITEAIKLMDQIGRDWKEDGQMQKFYATNYLIEAIRPLLRSVPSPSQGEADTLRKIKARVQYTAPALTTAAGRSMMADILAIVDDALEKDSSLRR